MLITQAKSLEEILKTILKKTLVIKCIGCKEVYFPEEDVNNLINELTKSNIEILDVLTCEYLCNTDFSNTITEKYKTQIENANSILVFSCGVGVQVIASILEEKVVLPGCDTLNIPGYQGLTSQNFNCDLCAECYLNYTAGLCPITSCSKSLLNGPCGGAKNGKCEVNKEMDCGWEKIYKRLSLFNLTKKQIDSIKIRSFLKLQEG
ncbi:MAG: methylenetetrahydrofolate reductase C-terminal domain-containing protein [Endomicrobiia bacterium]